MEVGRHHDVGALQLHAFEHADDVVLGCVGGDLAHVTERKKMRREKVAKGKPRERVAGKGGAGAYTRNGGTSGMGTSSREGPKGRWPPCPRLFLLPPLPLPQKSDIFDLDCGCTENYCNFCLSQ
jgi:hypothetical protein